MLTYERVCIVGDGDVVRAHTHTHIDVDRLIRICLCSGLVDVIAYIYKD
jgi:hypothetical protein